jgi:alkanesulfonate monooxygenase SsuD/methylene tetrahydromethanopterin reductase-like flavin-dependent oxidoreductase (luciferase family)
VVGLVDVHVDVSVEALSQVEVPASSMPQISGGRLVGGRNYGHVMQFSVTTGAAGDLDPRALSELAVVAEQAGWDGFFLEDYLVYQGRPETPTYDPWICLAAMACATTRIRLGTTVTPVPRRRPWKLAAEAVTLDHLSSGRLILGVGGGDPGDPGFCLVGEPTGRRVLAERLDEGLAVLSGLWNGEPLHYQGRHFRVNGLRLAATPVQRPRIPLWVGGDMLVPSVRRRIAQWDGCCAYKGPVEDDHPEITPEDVRGILALVARDRGTSEGFDIRVGGVDDPARVAALAEAGATWCGQWADVADPDDVRRVVEAGPPPV